MGLDYLIENSDRRKQEIAEELGVAPQTLSRWVKHDDEIPLKRLPDLLQAIGATRDDLIEHASPKLLWKLLDEGYFADLDPATISVIRMLLQSSEEAVRKIQETLARSLKRAREGRGEAKAD